VTLRNHNQKQIIGYLKNYIRNNKKKIDTSNSSICYFHNYGQLPGAATIRLKFFGFNYFFSYLKIFLKNILTVATLKNCKTTKTDQLNYKFKNLFISHVSKSDFNSDGSYKDKYFNINSKNFKNTLFFLNSIDHNLPKKISKNIVIFYNSDKFLKFDLFYFFQILCKEIKSYNFSIKKFLHEFSFLTQFSKIFNEKIISIINKNNFKKIMSFYEAQPYQNYLFKKLQKEKKIKTIGCYHSGLLPLHSSLIYREGTPNKILISGKFQREYLIKNLGWPSRKVFSTTSFRYKKLNRKIYEGYIFLPYTITFEKKILDGIENYFFKSKKGSLRRYKIKNHPHQGDSAVHNKIIKKIKLIMIKYHDRFTNKNKNKNKNSIFIGSTTSIILALDHGVEAVHVCEQPLFDSYNNGIWEPIRAKQLSENVLIYNMKKNRQILQIRNQHDSIKRYLN
tara:strand:+ start:14102 stop:15448 length:1347 start_codon:yes stop_codon:yes gene_type:complete